MSEGGFTPADRQAAWDAMSPLWREINRDMLSTIVSELVVPPLVLSNGRAGPPLALTEGLGQRAGLF
jgi:hypothetical protein